MLIPRRSVRTSQPQVPVGIDWSNPLTRGLVFAFCPSTGIDSVSGNAPPIRSGATSISISGAGTNPSRYEYQEPLSSTDPLAKRFDLTVFSAVVFGQQTTQMNANVIFCRGNGSSTPGWGVGFHGGSNNGAHAVVGNFAVYGVGGSTIDRPHLVSLTADGTTAKVYYDPILVSSGGYTGQAFQYGGGNRALLIGCDGQLTSGPSIGTFFALWNRVLSAKDVGELSYNPWQIFEDEEDYLFVPDASGGGSVSLIVADALHGHAVDSPSFSMATYLAVAESLHTQAADNLTLNTTGSANLAIQEAAHAHVSDGVALTTRWLLIVADALHTHAADNLTTGVTGATTLTVADATSVHTADSVALSVIAFLAIADAVSQHAADNLTLNTSNSTALTVQDSAHAHSTDGIGLSLNTWLAIVDAAHAHTADAPTLSASLALQIAEALHAHYADIAALSFPGAMTLTPDDILAIVAALNANGKLLTIPTFLALKD